MPRFPHNGRVPLTANSRTTRGRTASRGLAGLWGPTPLIHALDELSPATRSRPGPRATQQLRRRPAAPVPTRSGSWYVSPLPAAMEADLKDSSPDQELAEDHDTHRRDVRTCRLERRSRHADAVFRYQTELEKGTRNRRVKCTPRRDGSLTSCGGHEVEQSSVPHVRATSQPGSAAVTSAWQLFPGRTDANLIGRSAAARSSHPGRISAAGRVGVRRAGAVLTCCHGAPRPSYLDTRVVVGRQQPGALVEDYRAASSCRGVRRSAPVGVTSDLEALCVRCWSPTTSASPAPGPRRGQASLTPATRRQALLRTDHRIAGTPFAVSNPTLKWATRPSCSATAPCCPATGRAGGRGRSLATADTRTFEIAGRGGPLGRSTGRRDCSPCWDTRRRGRTCLPRSRCVLAGTIISGRRGGPIGLLGALTRPSTAARLGPGLWM